MEQKYILYKKEVITLAKGHDGLWYDKDGGIWGLHDSLASVDSRDVCGVGIFSLPEGIGNCIFHDNAYSIPAYQAFHTREEADRILMKQNPGLLGKIFYGLSRLFGGRYWENGKTR